jgi:hypothetical protein
MRSLLSSLVTVVFVFALSTSFATTKNTPPCCRTIHIPPCEKLLCCNGMGGISYCDSSAGRYVCQNGEYSSCYCTRHAVMDLQKMEGCCIWQGGVVGLGASGLVMCRNGSISETCSPIPPEEAPIDP